MSVSKRSAQKTFAADVVGTQDYKDSLIARAKAGTLAPAVEVRLLDLYVGKPLEEVRVTVTEDDGLDDLSDTELLGEIRALEVQLATRIAERTPTTDTVQ